MKNRNYVVFRVYGGKLDGWLTDKDHHEFSPHQKYAVKLTLKQASKLCFKANKEFERTYSYYVRYGYQLFDENKGE